MTAIRAAYDNGYIHMTRAGALCVSCEAYYQPEDLVDGLCPIHKRPVETLREENWFFQLSKFEDRLLD